jgi:hypothetical protein
VVHAADGWAAVTIDTDGAAVTAIHVVTNPAKLEHLVASLGDPATGRPGVWDSARWFRHWHGQPVR